MPIEAMRSAAARVCGGKPRVPRSWRDVAPGEEVPCPARSRAMLGARVALRGEGPVTVVGCAAPVLPSSRSRAYRSDRHKCQGAFLIQSPLGVRFAVPKTVLRERMRTLTRGEPCDRAVRLTGRMVSDWVAEGLTTPEAIRAAGVLPIPPGDLPFPHRKGGSPLCSYSPGMMEAERLVGEAESAALDRAREDTVNALVADGVMEPWDDPADLPASVRQRIDAGTLERSEVALAADKRPGLGKARALLKRRDLTVDEIVGRHLPMMAGSYRAEVATLKRRKRHAERGQLELEGGLAQLADDLASDLGDLRERYEVHSTAPLVARWFGSRGVEAARQAADYQRRLESWDRGVKVAREERARRDLRKAG